MARFKIIYVIALAALLAAEVVSAGDLVREFRGSRSATTVEFEVRAPWILDWRTATDFPGQMAVEITLVEAGTGTHQGLVLETKWPGNGVRLFDEGGKYQFKVLSNLARWTLKIEQLTRAEAEQYTPKGVK